MSTRWDELAAMLAAIQSSSVSGDVMRIYTPIGEGALADMLDDLAGRGWAVDRRSARNAKLARGVVRWQIVIDEDETRVVLLSDTPTAWSEIDRIMREWTASVHGAAAEAAVAPPSATDAPGQVSYLEHAASVIEDGARRVASLPGAAADAMRERVRSAAEQTIALGRDVGARLRGAADDLAERADKVVDRAKRVLGDVAGGIGAWIGANFALAAALGLGALYLWTRREQR